MKESFFKIFSCLTGVLIMLGTLTYAQNCIPGVVYITPGGATGGASGTPANPASLSYGLTLADANNNQLWLAAGTYTIDNTLQLISGITLEGGFDPATWKKSNNQPSVINRTNANIQTNPNRLVGIACENISNFNIHDIRVNVANAVGNGTTVYGIYVNGCSNYSIVRCGVKAGNGTDGTPGIPGVDGADGVAGQPGQNGDKDGACCRAGGAGGNSYPGSSSGGNGGDGGARGTGVCFGIGGTAPDGDDGEDGGGDNGGIGGAGGEGWCSTTGSLFGTIPLASYPVDGVDGTDGLDGADGQPIPPDHQGGFFIPGDGEDGEDGENGGGGGGGGGGNSQGCMNTCFGNNNGAGAGGGGGGEGGQGGTGAKGGTGGGGSFGIYITGNGPNGLISDCEIVSGLPGIGGQGGAPGGLGGLGGNGGNGGNGAAGEIAPGGRGGNGGRGGKGGNGGDGSPGLSFPVYEHPGGVPVIISDFKSIVEPTIVVENTGCTYSDIVFSTSINGIIQWFFDGGTVPLSAVGNEVTVQYTTPGRHTVTLIANGVPYIFTEFVGIFRDGEPFVPQIITASPRVCPGQAVSFSSSYAGLTYKWDFGNPASGAANTSAQATPTHTYTDLGKYNVTLQTTSPCCNRSKIDTLEIEVVPYLNTDVYVSAGAAEVCSGETVTFNAVPVNGGTNPAYQWQVNGTNAPSTSNTFSSSALNDGDVITAIMTSSYECPVNSPVTSLPYTIEVYPQPQVQCNATGKFLGASTAFDANINSGEPPFDYFWEFGDGGISNSVSPTHVYGGTGTYTATVTITDANGCKETCSMLVDIEVAPVVNANFDSQIVSDCGSVTASFTNTSQGATSEWKWILGDGTESNQENISHTYTTPGVYSVTLIASNGVYSDTITKPNHIIVNPNPIAGINIRQTTVCLPYTPVISDESIGATKWSWDFGDGKNSQLQNPGYFYETPGDYTIQLIVENDEGCTDAATVSISVLESPIAGFLTSDTITCTNLPIQFTDTSSGVLTWTWDFGDGNFSDITSPVHSYSEPGEYTVQLVVENSLGCTDTAAKWHHIEVVKNPEALFEADSYEIVLRDTAIQLHNYSDYYSEWFWVLGPDSTVILEHSPTVYYYEPGEYTIKLYILNDLGCFDTMSVNVIVHEQETVYIPNAFSPNGDGLNDVFRVFTQGVIQFNMMIFNRWGEMIYQFTDIDHFWDGKLKNGELAKEGAYAYKMELKWYTGKTFERTGTVILLAK